MSDSTISYNSGSPHYVDEVERMKKIIVEREDEICGLYKECREYKRVIKRVDAELLQLHKDSDRVIGLLEKSVEKWAGLYEVAEKERDDLRAAVELVRDACIEHASMAECIELACRWGATAWDDQSKLLQSLLDSKDGDTKSCATCSWWNGEECEGDDECNGFDCWEA